MITVRKVSAWLAGQVLIVLYNSKDAASFYSARWNTGTNLDLAFASVGPKSHLPDRCVLEKFPGHNIDLRLSHHQGLLWQCQACLLSDRTSARPIGVITFLWRINSQRLCCRLIHLLWMRLTRTPVAPLKKQPKRLSHAGIEITIFLVGMQSVNPSIKLSFSLLRETTQVWLLQLCLPNLTGSRNRWSEAVRSIDFSYFSRKAWSILNNLTGRSRHSPRHCPVLADAIASQLVKNGKYEAVERKPSRPVSQEVSDFWRATTLDPVNISDTFSQREFAAALQHLKPGKALGPDSICLELILHPGTALKSWLRDFFFSCLRRLKIPKIWRRALVVAIPKPIKPVGDPKFSGLSLDLDVWVFSSLYLSSRLAEKRPKRYTEGKQLPRPASGDAEILLLGWKFLFSFYKDMTKT